MKKRRKVKVIESKASKRERERVRKKREVFIDW